MTAPPHYDGFADWYDANIGPFADAAGRDLLELLGTGAGRCLDWPATPASTCAAWPMPAGP